MNGPFITEFVMKDPFITTGRGSGDTFGASTRDRDGALGEEVDLRQVVRSEVDVGRGEAGFDVGGFPRSHNGHVHARLRQRPRDRELTDRNPFAGGEFRELVDDGEVAAEVLPGECRRPRTPVGLLEGLLRE